MSDLEQLTQLVERLLNSTHTSMEHADQRQRDLMQQLIAGRPNAEAIRAEKISKLGAVLRKSLKLKDFKEGDMPIKEWLRRWNYEVDSQKKMCGIVGDLTRDEGISIFKDRLDFTVIKRLEMTFAGRDPVVTWEDVTWVDLSTILKEEFGPKVSQVGQVLQQFGPQRFKKTSEMTVASFTHDWVEQLPECMCPSTADEYQRFADLMRRTMFYYSLDDTYIQKDLCDMEGDPTFKEYFDQAVLSEQKRKSFSEIGDSSARLDPGGAACLALLQADQMPQAGEASVNYSGASYKYPGGQDHGRGRKFGRGAGGSSHDGDGSSGSSNNAFGGAQSGQQQPGFGGKSSGQQPRHSGHSGGNTGHFGGNSGQFGGSSDGNPGGRSSRQQPGYGRGRGAPGGVALAPEEVALQQGRSFVSGVERQVTSLPIARKLWLMWYKLMTTIKVKRRSLHRCLVHNFTLQISRQCQVSRSTLLASP